MSYQQMQPIFGKPWDLCPIIYPIGDDILQTSHETYMQAALSLAAEAAAQDEVPVGCVIVHGDEIVGRGFNLRNTMKSVLCHAELTALAEASAALGDWRLEDCTLYVTVEPCPMCAGAIVQARIKEVVFGTRNRKAGCAGSILDILNEPRFNHQVTVIEGVLADECAAMMSNFFKSFRQKKAAPVLRSYRAEDNPQLAALFFETIHAVTAADYTEAQREAWAPQNIDADTWCTPFLHDYTLIAEQGNTIVGFANLTAGGHLDRLYVHKGHQRKGIAAQLTAALHAQAQADGHSEITADVSITAKPFFLAQGYTVVQENRVERAGQYLTNYTMKHQLTTHTGGRKQ